MRAFDNKGKSFDRYTVVAKDGSMFGFSENPFSPNGFNQYLGDFKGVWGDEEISFEDLPIEVQKAAKERI